MLHVCLSLSLSLSLSVRACMCACVRDDVSLAIMSLDQTSNVLSERVSERCRKEESE